MINRIYASFLENANSLSEYVWVVVLKKKNCVFFLYNFLIAYFRRYHIFINFVLFMFLQLKKKRMLKGNSYKTGATSGAFRSLCSVLSLSYLFFPLDIAFSFLPLLTAISIPPLVSSKFLVKCFCVLYKFNFYIPLEHTT